MPRDYTIHLIIDDLSSHTRQAVVGHFGEEAGGWLWNQFTVHYTPKQGRWLNQAGIATSMFSRQCLGKRRIGDRDPLRKETRAWNRRMNHDRVMIQWRFTRKLTRHKFGCAITRSRLVMKFVVMKYTSSCLHLSGRGRSWNGRHSFVRVNTFQALRVDRGGYVVVFVSTLYRLVSVAGGGNQAGIELRIRPARNC